MKDEKINIRLSKNDKAKIINKANKCKMNMSQYIIKSCLKDNIIVIDGIDKLESEVRRIGNNLNQLTRSSNEGIIKVLDLRELRMEVNNIWQLLKQLAQKQA